MIRIHWTVLLVAAGLLISGAAALGGAAWSAALLPCDPARAVVEAIVTRAVIGAALQAAGLSVLAVGGLLSHLHSTARPAPGRRAAV
jgi:hypothetical protein